MIEPEYEDIQAELSFFDAPSQALVSRRAVLMALAAGASLAMLPEWMTKAAYAAEPLGADEGVLVVIQLGGGNDGLNTVIPTGNGTYYDKRKSLAIPANSALPLASGVGLHPSLVKLKERYDQGKVAVIQGIGHANPNLSHFDSMATWMSGWAGGPTRTGWLGRYLDGLGTDPFYGLTLGSGVPLHLIGSRSMATSLPVSKSNIFGADLSDPVTRRLCDGIKAFGDVSPGLGSLADQVVSAGRRSLDVSTMLAPAYPAQITGASGSLTSQMDLCARLVNANLGVRVFNVSLGSFDTHSGQAGAQKQKFVDLDAAIDTFFKTLAPEFAGRVTLMTFSEFGRRVETNGSSGTDHGTASVAFVVGDKVRGGLYGEQPSLTNLDSAGNMRATVDFHSLYATMTDKWLDGDSRELLGANFEPIDLFLARPNGPVIQRPVPVAPPVVAVPPPAPAATAAVVTGRPVTWPKAYRLVTARGAVHSYGGANTSGDAPSSERAVSVVSTPDQKGYWVATQNGNVHAFGSAGNHGSMAGQRLNAPIVGMAATATGKGYWLLGRDGGIFSYGDAQFFGSTGSLKLNQPVVGITAAPNGGGYWFVASDGGIFSFGPGAQFYGSTGSMRLNKPVVSMAATPSGKGYWLVASDGGIFSFGDAEYFGSTGAMKLNQPIVGLAPTPTGKGYRFVAADGGIFCFGDASFEGGLGAGSDGTPVVGIAT